MYVKIGKTIYSTEKEPIMLILNKSEKQQISNMSSDINKCCFYNGNEKEWIGKDYQKIKEWMKNKEN